MMAVLATTYQETSIGWQLRQFRNQTGEWFEAQFNQWLPSWSPPDVEVETPNWTGRILIVVAVIVLLVWIGWQIYVVLRPYISAWLAKEKGRRLTASADQEHILHSSQEWVERSRQAQRDGNYRDACRALYMAMLQRLDDRNQIRLTDSRTDGEYQMLLWLMENPAPYQLLFSLHERLLFGQHPVSAEECDRCWQAYQEIDQA
jgi:hypothetical protein